MKTLYVYDIEVRRHDWEVVFVNANNTKEVVGFHNDTGGLIKWFESRKENAIFFGFNSKNYDDYILTAMLLEYDNEKIKELNDWIIAGKAQKQGSFAWVNQMSDDSYGFWAMRSSFYKFDLKNESQNQTNAQMSLKEYQCYKGDSIVEADVNFQLDRPMTEEELTLDLKYCLNDVLSTIRLLNEPESIAQFKIKWNMCEEFGLDFKKHGNKTAAQFVELALGVETKTKFEDDFKYKMPDNIKIEDNKDVIDFFLNNETGQGKLSINYAGLKTTFGYGGGHGVDGKTRYYNTRILSIDVLSYYPNLIMLYNYMSRNVLDPKRYKQIYDLRVHLKSIKDDKQLGYKLILNATSGAMGANFNKMYDPRMRNSMCITGQLFLLDLMEKVKDYCKIINVNTDGIFVIPHSENDETIIRELVSEWESRSKFTMEIDVFKTMIQKDVNNYIAITEDDKIKFKGADVKFYDDKRNTGHSFKNNLYIVQKALVRYLIWGTPIEETIMNPENIMDYQFVQKRTGLYYGAIHEVNGEHVEIQKVNRVFATTDKSYGTIKKLKWVTKDGEKTTQFAKPANTPDSCFIYNHNINEITDVKGWLENVAKIDYQYYINMTEQKIKLWGGK